MAELVQMENRLSFCYLDDAQLGPARQDGLMGYPGLPSNSPELDRIAEEALMRPPSPTDRRDFGQFLERFGLPPDARYPPLPFLASTGARLTGDTFSECETFDGLESPFTYPFDVAGTGHHKDHFN